MHVCSVFLEKKKLYFKNREYLFVEIQSPLIIGSNFFLSSEGDYFITVVQVMRNITSNNFGRDLLKASNDFIISVSPVFVCVSVE